MEALLASLVGVNIPIDDARTMELTTAELQRAWRIKQAVERDDALRNLRDFDYVQFALAHPTDEAIVTPLETVLHHVAHMQAFRQEYQIQETLEEGMSSMDAMTRLQPDLFLGIQYLAPSGNCLGLTDWAGFAPGNIATTEQTRSFMKGFYYRLQCMSPTFWAIREGISSLIECDGASWDNTDANLQEKILTELYMNYPKRHKETFLVNSPSVVNVLYGMWKKYFSNNMKSTLHLGYQVPGMEGRRIDVLFRTPTPELARQKMLANALHFLQVRYQHQQAYVLPRILQDDNEGGQPQMQPQQQQQAQIHIQPQAPGIVPPP